MKLFSHVTIALLALPIAAWAMIPGQTDRAARTISANPEPGVQRENVSPDMTPAGPDMAWVDPVITGPVSSQFKRIRQAAHCDTAKWPDIPAVCYPD